MTEKKKRRLILQESDSDDPPPSPRKAEQNGVAGAGEGAAALEEAESGEKMATMSSEAAVSQGVKAEDPEPLSDENCSVTGAKAEGEDMPLISDGLDSANSSVTVAVEAAIPIPKEEEVKADNSGNSSVVAEVPVSVEPVVPQEQVKVEDSEMGLISDPAQNGSNSNLAVLVVAPPQEVSTGPLQNEDSTVPEVIVKNEKMDTVEQREEASTQKLKGEVDARYNKEEGKKVAVFKRREELRIDRKKSGEDSAEKGILKFERRREVKPVSDKQREDAGGFKENLVEDKKNSTERRDTGKMREETGTLRKKIVEDKKSSAEKRDSGKVREEVGILRKKILDDKTRSEEKRDTGKERVSRQDSGKLREEEITFKKKYEEYKRKSLEGNSDKVVKVEKLNSGKQRESSTLKLKAEEEIKVDKKKLLRPAKNTKEAPSFMKKALERSTRVEEPKVSSKIEFKDGRKRPLSPNSVKRSEELHSAKKKVLEFKTKEEFILARKRAAMVDIGEKRDGAVSGKKKVAEPNVDKGVDKKKSAVSDDVNKRESAGQNKKKAAEPSGRKSGGKRRREASESDSDISLKRIKTELKSWEVETKKADGKKMKLATKSVASSDEETDDLNETSSLAKLRKTFMPKAEKESDITQKNKLPELKVHIRSEDEENSEHSSSASPSSSNCSTPVHPDGSTDELVVEKPDFTGSLDKFQVTNNSLQEKHKSTESKRKLRSSSAVLKTKPPGQKRKLRTSSAGAKNKSSESKRKLRTSSPEPNNSVDEKHKSHDSRISSPEPDNSEDEKHKSSESKIKRRSSSAEVKKKVLSSKKPGSGRKGEGNSSLKTPLSMKKPKNSTEGRASVKRQITDKIKALLLNSGWKIDLRPRRGRNYEDQVYIPPTGGSGYWSITKAYTAFQKLSGATVDVKSNSLPGESSNKSTGDDNNPEEVGCSSSIIPAELLSMLKRNVVNKRRNKISKDYTDTKGNTRQKRRGLLVRGSNQAAETGDDGYVPYVWKRTVLSWMIDVGVVPLNGKVNYMNKRQTRSLLDGQVVREGIQCNCCSKVITVSKFEVHAGSKLQQPYENIFVEELGISLLQCQQEAWEKQDKSERQGFCTVDIEGDDPNDDACGVCGNGGDLICCDGCPSTFHQSCLGIEVLPLGSWHCTYCSCRYCGLVSKASAEGTEFLDSPLLSCNQCEKKYHQGCIPEEDVLSTISNNLKDSFCGKSCRKVFRRLQKLLGIKNDLEGGLSWRLIRRLDEDDIRLPSSEVFTRAECNAKIAIALAVMDECFLPIIDQTSNINLIHNVVYNCGSNFNRLNYSGFYTFTLERGDEVICVASVRIHGTRLAEMPFIGTRNMYRRQGMCKRLLDKIESALRSLGIRKLIIPAISELKDTWTTVFGFEPLSISAKEDVRSMNILVFPDTGLLEKLLQKKSSSQLADKDVKIDPTIKQDDTFKMEDKASMISSVGPILHPSDEGIVHPEDDVKNIKCNSPAVDCCDPSSFNVVPKTLEQNIENAAGSGSSTQQGSVCHDEPVGSLAVCEAKLPSVDIAHDTEDLQIEDVLLKSHAVDDTSVQHTSEVNCTSLAATVSTLPDCGLKTSPFLPCSDATLSRHNSDSHCISSDISTSTLPDSGGNDIPNPVSSLESIADTAYQNPFDEGTEVAAVKAKPNAGVEDAEPEQCGVSAGSFHVSLGKESQASNGTYACNVITKPLCAAPGEAHQVSESEKPLQQNSKTVTESSEFHVLEHNEHNSVPGDADNGPRGNAPAVPYSIGSSALNGDHSVMGICELGGLCESSDIDPAKTLNTIVCSKSAMVNHDFKGDDELTAKPLEPNDSYSEVTPDIGTSKDESACMHTAHAFGLNSSHCPPEVVTTSMGEGKDAFGGERGR